VTNEAQRSEASASADLLDRVDIVLRDGKGPMTAADIARELNRRGWLPGMWTTLDVADFMRDWYGSGPPRD